MVDKSEWHTNQQPKGTIAYGSKNSTNQKIHKIFCINALLVFQHDITNQGKLVQKATGK